MITLLSIVGYGVFVFAVGPFAPGTELDPACSPYINNDPLQGVDTDCTVTAGGAGWGLTGNTGTDDTVNFIGTTDAQDFVIKTDSVQVARFGTAMKGIVIGRTYGPDEFFPGSLTMATQATQPASVAIGSGSEATGIAAFAIGGGNPFSGTLNTASGTASFAFGLANTVTATNNFAFGEDNVVGGTSGDSFAFGEENSVSSILGDAYAFGITNDVSGESAFAIGRSNVSSGYKSFALGNDTTASGSYSATFGYEVQSSSGFELSTGSYNTLYTPVADDVFYADDRLFTVGNGLDDSNRSDAFTILKDGRVGIAYDNFETTPYDITDILQVNGRVRATDLIVENSNQTLVSYFSSNGPSTRLGINSNTGNVGFGLYINDYLWFSNAVVNYNGGAFDYAIYNDPQGTKALTIDGDTNFIGINFPNAIVPAYQFDVNYPGSGIVAQFANNVGECTVNPTAGTFACSSDQRLKKNITPLESTTTLEKVLALQGVTYNWNSESDTVDPKIGFIAQQVETVFPEFVSETGNGMKSVAYGSLTPVLVEAIKELNLKIEAIESASSSVVVVASGFSLDGLRTWLGDVTNGIEKLFAREITTRSLCIEDDQGVTCLNRSQVDALINSDANTEIIPEESGDEPVTDPVSETGLEPTPEPEVITEPEPQVVQESVPETTPESITAPEPPIE